MFGNVAFGEVPFGEQAPLTLRLTGEADLDINFNYTLRVASRRLFTPADDTPSRTPFDGVLQSFELERTLLGGAGFGPFVEGKGTLSVLDVAGDYDFLPQQYSLNGRPIIVRLGRYGDRVRDGLTIFNATASDFAFQDQRLQIAIEDNGYRLTVPFQTKLYGGTGGADGGPDLAGKPKPRNLGYNRDCSGPLINAAKLITQFGDGPSRAVTAVKVRRSPLSFAGDYPNYAALEAASMTPGSGTYATCLAESLHRLSDEPVGELTADVEGDYTGGVFASSRAAIIRHIIRTSTAIADPGGLYLPGFAAFDVAQAAAAGIYTDHNDSSTVADIVARLLLDVRGWIGDRSDGKLDIGIFSPPVGPPVMRLDTRHIPENGVNREALPSGLTPPPSRWRIGYARNNTVATDIAAIASAAERAFATEEYRYAVAESAQTRIDYPNAPEPAPVPGCFAFQPDAQTEATARLDAFRRTRALYRIKTYLLPYKLNIGEVFHVTWPRWDLKVGRLLRVAAVKYSNEKSEIVGYG